MRRRDSDDASLATVATPDDRRDVLDGSADTHLRRLYRRPLKSKRIPVSDADFCEEEYFVVFLYIRALFTAIAVLHSDGLLRTIVDQILRVTLVKRYE